MIESIDVKGLNGKLDLNLTFNRDINLFTGKNGSGKTSLMKLMWYMLKRVGAGDIRQEIAVNYALLKTDRGSTGFGIDAKGNSEGTAFNIFSQSLFFPTFRRIEGGFSASAFLKPNVNAIIATNLEKSLNEFAASMSENNQRIVTSISIKDLIPLINEEYANISEQFNKKQKELSDTIIEKIKKREQGEKELLDLVQLNIEETEKIRTELYRPFTVLLNLIKQFFEYKGEKWSKDLSIENLRDIVLANKLSAGEQQMLSFLCYNAFSKNTVIFIDEPELSLHPDWQRRLIPTLLAQGTNNQFFIATHSPFIYAAYADKEFTLNIDKGHN
jgi:predicted ATPase